MNFDMEKFQLEVREWSKQHFKPVPSDKLLGMVEEVGELISTLDEYMNLRRSWSVSVDDIQDAIGDLMVFAADYCTTRHWSLRELDLEAVKGSIVAIDDDAKEPEVHSIIDQCLRNMTVSVSLVCRSQVKINQGIRGTVEEHTRNGRAQLVKLIRNTRSICGIFEFDFLEVIDGVWSKVKKRNWTEDPVTAGGHA